jgi:hypothetical protein
MVALPSPFERINEEVFAAVSYTSTLLLPPSDALQQQTQPQPQPTLHKMAQWHNMEQRVKVSTRIEREQ